MNAKRFLIKVAGVSVGYIAASMLLSKFDWSFGLGRND